MTENREQEVFE